MGYYILENAEGKKVYVEFDHDISHWLIESDYPRFCERFPNSDLADNFLITNGYRFTRDSRGNLVDVTTKKKEI